MFKNGRILIRKETLNISEGLKGELQESMSNVEINDWFEVQS